MLQKLNIKIKLKSLSLIETKKVKITSPLYEISGETSHSVESESSKS